jgi:hypothetical protein
LRRCLSNYTTALLHVARFLIITRAGDKLDMKPPKKAHLDMNLSQGLSHIRVQVPENGFGFDVREYLSRRGVTIETETSSIDDNGREWLIVSVSVPDVTQLVLELVEKGLSSNIQGINAKKDVRPDGSD